jgi:flap endonuclease-1
MPSYSSSQLIDSEERVRKGAEKLVKFLNAKQQGRLDGFFAVQPKKSPQKAAPQKGKGKDSEKAGTKRKVCS